MVDTGVWIFGKKRMLPAGVIDRIDYDGRKVYVNLTKDEIRQAPDYDAEREREEAYRQDVGTYYGPSSGPSLASPRTDRMIAGASRTGGTGLWHA